MQGKLRHPGCNMADRFVMRSERCGLQGGLQWSAPQICPQPCMFSTFISDFQKSTDSSLIPFVEEELMCPVMSRIPKKYTSRQE